MLHEVERVTVTGCVFRSVGGRAFTTTLENTGSKQDATDLMVSDSVFDGCGEVKLVATAVSSTIWEGQDLVCMAISLERSAAGVVGGRGIPVGYRHQCRCSHCLQTTPCCIFRIVDDPDG